MGSGFDELKTFGVCASGMSKHKRSADSWKYKKAGRVWFLNRGSFKQR